MTDVQDDLDKAAAASENTSEALDSLQMRVLLDLHGLCADDE